MTVIKLDGSDRTLRDGHRVKIKLGGDENYYIGSVIKHRKMWVECDHMDGGQAVLPFIADETNIVYCELLK